MDQNVAESDDFSKVRNLRRKLRIRTRQLCQRFTNYLELSFDRRMENDIRVELLKRLPCKHRRNCLGGLLRVPEENFRIELQTAAPVSARIQPSNKD